MSTILNLTKEEIAQIRFEVTPCQIIEEIRELERMLMNRHAVLQEVFPEEYKKFKIAQEN